MWILGIVFKIILLDLCAFSFLEKTIFAQPKKRTACARILCETPNNAYCFALTLTISALTSVVIDLFHQDVVLY